MFRFRFICASVKGPGRICLLLLPIAKKMVESLKDKSPVSRDLFLNSFSAEFQEATVMSLTKTCDYFEGFTPSSSGDQ